VQRLDRALVLRANARGGEAVRVERAEEVPRDLGAAGQRRVGRRVLGVRGEDLEAVVADVGHVLQADDAARLGSAAAGYAGGERVALGDRREQIAGGRRHRHGARIGDDRRQGPIDVAQHGGGYRVGAQRLDQICDSSLSGGGGGHRI